MPCPGHGACCLGPAGSGAPDALDNQPPQLGVQLDFVGQLRLIQKDFRDADATGVADANDTGLGGHVTTL